MPVAVAWLTVADLEPFADIEPAKAAAMVADAVALAARVAPCITADDFAHGDAAKAILRGAVLRWNDSGTGAFQSQTVGPFNQALDTRQARRSLFWPSEIEQLQELCRTSTAASGAFSIDTVGAATVVHADTCSLRFGATYCSCGAILSGAGPLYGA